MSDSRTRKISLDRLNKRRMSVPVLPTIEALAATAPMAAAKKGKKGVHFPLGILMQQAVTNGDTKEIKELVKDFGTEALDEREPSGLPPLMRSIFEGQLESLKYLIEAGADMSAKDTEDWNILHVAAAMDDYEAAEVIILSCGKDVENMLAAENMAGERPMDLAENIRMARLLLHADLAQFRLEVEESSSTEASMESEAAVIRLVQDYCKKHDECKSLNSFLKQNTPYRSLLHLAATRNYARLAEFLLANKLSPTELRDKNGWTALHTAVYYNSTEVALVLTDHKANTNSLTHAFEKPGDLTENELIHLILGTPVQMYSPIATY